MPLFYASSLLSIAWLLVLVGVMASRARFATQMLAAVWVFGLGTIVGWAVLLIVAPALIDHALGLRAGALLFSTFSGHGGLDVGPLYSGLFTTVGTLAVAVAYVPLRAVPWLIRQAMKVRNGGAA
ncbi:MAG: hypothetical protein VB137_04125 [Burkholderia sp.]